MMNVFEIKSQESVIDIQNQVLLPPSFFANQSFVYLNEVQPELIVSHRQHAMPILDYDSEVDEDEELKDILPVL